MYFRTSCVHIFNIFAIKTEHICFYGEKNLTNNNINH